MGKKIAIITLIHQCDENPCHLDNRAQEEWIKRLMPIEKLSWNWKLHTIRVVDIVE
ncbi:MAG: hypothetical protein RMJ31_00975 [Nitrososphaerota archaeon]|nr:hypothetical protein [Nitrososphaerales archaeon]MDW8044337.1 hypothetical protein [Nitrososphaerota archaeon]